MTQRWYQFRTGILFGALPILSLLLFIPFTIYHGNLTEFSAPFAGVQLQMLPGAAAAIALLGVFASLMTQQGHQRFVAMLAAIAILIWLQANIMVWDYGVLDGRSIEWLARPWLPVIDTFVWAALVFVAIAGYKRFGSLLRQAAVATVFIQAVAFMVILVTASDELPSSASLKSDAASQEAQFRFAESDNVLHIVMDGFQTDILEAIIKDRPDIGEQLTGFTIFRENLGAYPYTQMSIPALLSGKYYRNEIPHEEFVDRTLAGNTVTNAAFAAGFEVDIAAQVALRNVYAKGRHSTAFGISSGAHATEHDYVVNDATKLLDLSLFRALPHFGKALVYRDGLWVFQGLVRDAAYLQMQYFSDLKFLRDLALNMRADRGKPTYKLFHLMLSHRPTVGEADCSFAGVKTATRESVTSQSECGLRTVLAVLDRMKQLGIYDSSTIVLMADHGAWVAVDDMPGLRENPAIDPIVVAMAMPALAIKPAGEDGKLQYSSAQTSISDLPATLASLLSLDASFPGESVFSIDETQNRTRLHYTYFFGRNKDHDGYLLPLHEKLVTGSIYESDSWRRGKRYDPRQVVDAHTDTAEDREN